MPADAAALRKSHARQSRSKKVTAPESAAPAYPVSYDSIGAAAAGLQVSVAILKKAKRAGAPGFKCSRVYPLELLPWLRARETGKKKSSVSVDDKDSLEIRLLLGKCEQVEFENCRRRGEFLERSSVDAWLAERIERSAAILRQSLLSELPPALVGLATAAIAARLEKTLADVIAALRG